MGGDKDLQKVLPGRVFRSRTQLDVEDGVFLLFFVVIGGLIDN